MGSTRVRSSNARSLRIRVVSDGYFKAMGIPVVAYSLSLRIREVGIRIAMGAGPRDVIVLISRQGLVPALAGLGLGLILAAGLTRLLGRMLYTVSPYDPAIFVLSVVALGVVSALAAGLAAFQACRIDASTLLK